MLEQQINPFHENGQTDRPKSGAKRRNKATQDTLRTELRAAELRDAEVATERLEYLRARIAPEVQKYHLADAAYQDALRQAGSEGLKHHQELAWARTQSELEHASELKNACEAARMERERFANELWDQESPEGLKQLQERTKTLIQEILRVDAEFEYRSEVQAQRQKAREVIYKKIIDELDHFNTRISPFEHPSAFVEQVSRFLETYGSESLSADVLREYHMQLQERALFQKGTIDTNASYAPVEKKRLFAMLAMYDATHVGDTFADSAIDHIDPENASLFHDGREFERARFFKEDIFLGKKIFLTQRMKMVRQRILKSADETSARDTMHIYETLTDIQQALRDLKLLQETRAYVEAGGEYDMGYITGTYMKNGESYRPLIAFPQEMKYHRELAKSEELSAQ